MKKVLLVIHTNTYFTWLIDIARLLKKTGRYEPVLLFKDYPTRARDIALCRAEHINALNDEFDASSSSLWARLSARIRYHAKASFLLSLLCEVFSLRKKLTDIRAWLEENHITLIILAGDLVAYDTAMYIRSGQSLGIKTVVIPGWMAGPLEPVQAIFHNQDHWLTNIANRLFAKRFPQWVYEHNGRKLLRLPAAKALALEWFGLGPPQPWILHSGYADAIALESEAMLEYAVREGLATNQMLVTGSVAGDVLAERMSVAKQERNNLYEKSGLPPMRRMLLCALPPNMIGGFFQPECEFADYDELVDFWVNSLKDIPGYNVVFTLHPSVTNDKKSELIERYGICIADVPTVLLIPLCHLFVASISSTIQWAIACGKPVINFDVYRYRYKDYESVGGVFNVESQEAYLRKLQLLTGDEAYYKLAEEKQQQCKEFWGKTDGRSGERLLSLFDQMIAADIDSHAEGGG